jgi:hypothetical protein
MYAHCVISSETYNIGSTFSYGVPLYHAHSAGKKYETDTVKLSDFQLHNSLYRTRRPVYPYVHPPPHALFTAMSHPTPNEQATTSRFSRPRQT